MNIFSLLFRPPVSIGSNLSQLRPIGNVPTMISVSVTYSDQRTLTVSLEAAAVLPRKKVLWIILKGAGRRPRGKHRNDYYALLPFKGKVFLIGWDHNEAPGDLIPEVVMGSDALVFEGFEIPSDAWKLVEADYHKRLQAEF